MWANAAGVVIPPMVIFEGQCFNPEWSRGEVPDTLYGMSDNGWTDQELLFYWLTELFVKQIPPLRPVILLLDGHSSHYEPECIRAAAEQGIIVFCLPLHSTHVAQPLDVSFFQPLKVSWSEACHTFMRENPGCVVMKYQFSQLFSKAWYKAFQPNNLISGFAKTGIHPFNSEAISVPTLPDLEEMMEEGAPEDNQGVKATAFSHSELELFTTRYENGYDIYTNTEYMIWLAENHPDALPDDVLNTLQSRSDSY